MTKTPNTTSQPNYPDQIIPNKPQPGAEHAVNTARISADLRRIEQEARELPRPSPTAGMNLGQRILHVGGRENAAGYIEFGSVAAVRALVSQVLRDLQAASSAPAAVPVLYVSPGQLENNLDPESAEGGRYLPARKTPAGKFTQPLYTLAAAPAQGQVLCDEDHVLVPRGLIGSACFAINHKCDAPHTLAKLRRYNVGDLTAAAPAQEHATQREGQAVARIRSVDEFGPCLDWFKHWVNFPAGTLLYAHAAPYQAQEDTPEGLTQAARNVLAERQRQISAEGYDPEHDDSHELGEIGALAALYLMPQGAREWDTSSTGYGATLGEALLPADWNMPKMGEDTREDLVKGVACGLAELERLDRAAARAAQGGAA